MNEIEMLRDDFETKSAKWKQFVKVLKVEDAGVDFKKIVCSPNGQFWGVGKFIAMGIEKMLRKSIDKLVCTNFSVENVLAEDTRQATKLVVSYADEPGAKVLTKAEFPYYNSREKSPLYNKYDVIGWSKLNAGEWFLVADDDIVLYQKDFIIDDDCLSFEFAVDVKH